MIDPPLGVRWTEHLSGQLTGAAVAEAEVELDVGVELRDMGAFAADRSSPGELVGAVRHPAWGRPLLAGGRFQVATTGPDAVELGYRAVFRADGRDHVLVGTKRVRDDPGFDLWSDVSTLFVEVREGSDDGPVMASGELRAGVGDVRRAVASLEPTGAHHLRDRARAVTTVGRVLLGRLWERYGGRAEEAGASR
jgi:cholesterol oxidase